MKKIRVLVLDGQTIVREGLVAIMAYYSDIEVVGEVGSCAEALRLVKQTLPDVVLMDPVFKDQDGMTTISLIRKNSPHTRVLVLTSEEDAEFAKKVIKAGALGYMLRDINHIQLLEAIRNVSRGYPSLHPMISLMLIHEISGKPEEPDINSALTPREKETLQLIARGLSNGEIADTLVVHERTVAKYVSSILAKLGLSNRTQAALYALQLNSSEKKP